MKRRTELSREKQGEIAPLGQMLLPMVAGMASTRQELTQFVYARGLEALQEVFEMDAEHVAGAKGRHNGARGAYHWGATPAELPFGGRRIAVRRPRVRTTSGSRRA